jgi:cell division protein FtsB
MGVAKTRKIAPARNVKKMIIGSGILLCFAIIVLSLYAPVKSYYLASRANERLQHEYVAVEDRNDQIRAQIAYLNTAEGIADRARERFGWVPEGEQAVNITGLEVSDSTTVLPATVASGSVDAPNTQWTDFLDALFGVEEKEVAEPVPDPFLAETDVASAQ